MKNKEKRQDEAATWLNPAVGLKMIITIKEKKREKKEKEKENPSNTLQSGGIENGVMNQL